MHEDTSHEVRHRDNWVRVMGASEAGRGVGAAVETPTMGVVVESRTDANSTSRLARWSSLGTPPACPLGGVERPPRMVRFARLMQGRVRVLGVPSVSAAFGDSVSLP